MRGWVAVGVVVVMSGTLTSDPAWAANRGRLDGQIYEAAALEDQLTFDGGRFSTRKSTAAGYEPASYWASPWGGGIGFRAKLRNRAGRTMQWQGLITGDILDGEIVADAEQGGPRTKTPFTAQLK